MIFLMRQNPFEIVMSSPHYWFWPLLCKVLTELTKKVNQRNLAFLKLTFILEIYLSFKHCIIVKKYLTESFNLSSIGSPISEFQQNVSQCNYECTKNICTFLYYSHRIIVANNANNAWMLFCYFSRERKDLKKHFQRWVEQENRKSERKERKKSSLAFFTKWFFLICDFSGF